MIYGSSGGVAESVVRYCLPDKSKNTLRELQYSPLRGNEAIREATVQVGEREIKLAVVHGLINAQKLLKEIDAGTAYYDLVEVMTCPSGCVGGAGQPYGLKQKKQDRPLACMLPTGPLPSSARRRTRWFWTSSIITRPSSATNCSTPVIKADHFFSQNSTQAVHRNMDGLCVISPPAARPGEGSP